MNTALGSQLRMVALVASVGLMAIACGQGKVGGGTGTVPSYLGASCGSAQPVVQTEVAIELKSPECEAEGVCFRGKDVASGAAVSAGMCSCHCDGPDGTGPFCSCGDDFVCHEEVRDLGLGPSGDVGSYCVPKQ